MKKFTKKQEKFIEEMAKNGGNQRQAYRAAYNAKNMSDATVDKRASELVKTGSIRGRLDEIMQKAREASISKASMDVEKIIENYAIIANADIGDFYDFSTIDKPRVIDLSKVDTRAIKQIRTDPKTGKVTGILMHEKLYALTRLEEIFDVKGNRAGGDTGLEIKFDGDMEEI